MDLRDSPAQAEFRARLRAWLGGNAPDSPETGDDAAQFAALRRWQQRLHQAGWIGLSWPREFGGQGLTDVEEAILAQELARAGAPSAIPTAHLGRPLLSHGTDEQRRRHLPGLLSGDVAWCQGFSEPDAGSDLAALRSEARLEGDTYVITGQKIWTSFAAYAEMCLLLARTDPEAPRHRGISCFVLALDSPGVTVRPIVMANGDREFGEIFLDGVRVPASDLLGAPGDGWSIAMATIAAERGAADIGYQAKFERYFHQLAAEAARVAGGLDPLAQATLGRARVELDVFAMHCLRRLSERASGRGSAAASSIDKLVMTRVEQTLLQAAVDLDLAASGERRGEWFDRYLYARAGSIYGGTAQIQKNILATRVLGLGGRR